MRPDNLASQLPIRTSCCPCGHPAGATHAGTTRREFLTAAGGLGLIGTALTGISWSAIAAERQAPPKRRALVVKPIFTYPKPERRPQTSWRNWGGIQTEEDVRAEVSRIHGELDQLKTKADSPLDFLPLATVRRPEEFAAHENDMNSADVLLFYAGGDGGGNLMANVNHLDRLGQDIIFFVRHRSGPLYYWYEGAMARFLHQHTDELATKTVGYEDVVIPAGILLASTCDRPVFLNDPTYPHDGIITLAHCTAPRRMGGEKLDPARIMTHFESDYGAAPKVEMPVGQTVTNIVPDFKAERWTGLLARIDAAPFLPICRSQIDIRFDCSDDVLARHMPGFHWITGYGDYLREIGYALRRVSIQWDCLG